MDSYLSQGMNPGFELVSPSLFPATITITPRAPPKLINSIIVINAIITLLDFVHNDTKAQKFYPCRELNLHNFEVYPSRFNRHFCTSLFVYFLKCISDVIFKITNASWFSSINFVLENSPKEKSIG